MLGEARIEKGEIIAEATSGNTGVALAALGAVWVSELFSLFLKQQVRRK